MSDEPNVQALADWLLIHAHTAFPWPGELEMEVADDLAQAILASDWYATSVGAAVTARGESLAEELTDLWLVPWSNPRSRAVRASEAIRNAFRPRTDDTEETP